MAWKLGPIALLFYIQCALATEFSQGVVLPSALGDDVVQLRDDFALALITSGYPDAVGLGNLPSPRTFRDLRNELAELGAYGEAFMASGSAVQEKDLFLASYYDLLSKLIHLDYLQNGRLSFDVEDFYITIGSSVIEEWGGEAVVHELNSQQQSHYYLSEVSGGYRIEFKDRSLWELQMASIPLEDEKERLLARGKMVTRETLLNSLVTVSSLLENPWERVGFDLGNSGEKLLRARVEAVKRERALEAAIHSEEIRAILLAPPLVGPQLVVDILEKAIYPGMIFSLKDEGVAELETIINENGHLAIESMGENMASYAQRNFVDDFIEAWSLSRKKLLFDLVFTILTQSEGVELDDRLMGRLLEVIQGHSYDEEWKGKLSSQLQSSPRWREVTTSRWAVQQLARDLVRAVYQTKGDKELVGSYREQVNTLILFNLQKLQQRRLTTAMALAIRGIEEAPNFEQAKEGFWKSFSKQLERFNPQIVFHSSTSLPELMEKIELTPVAAGYFEFGVRTDLGLEFVEEVHQRRKQDLIALLNLASALELDREKGRTVTEQLGQLREENPNAYSDLLSFKGMNTFPILNVKLEETEEEKRKRLEDWARDNRFKTYDASYRKEKRLHLVEWIEDELERYSYWIKKSEKEKRDELTDWARANRFRTHDSILRKKPKRTYYWGGAIDEIAQKMLPVLNQAILKVQENIGHNIERIDRAKHLGKLRPLFVDSAKMQQMLQPYALPAHARYIDHATYPGAVEKAWETLVGRYVHNGFTLVLALHLGSFFLKFSKSMSLASTFLRNAYHSIPTRHLTWFFWTATPLFFGEIGVVGYEYWHKRHEHEQMESFFQSYLEGEEGLFQYENILQKKMELTQAKFEFYPSVAFTPLFFMPILMLSKTVQHKAMSFFQGRLLKRVQRMEQNFHRLGFRKHGLEDAQKGLSNWDPDTIKLVARQHRDEIFKGLDESYQKVMEGVGSVPREIRLAHLMGRETPPFDSTELPLRLATLTNIEGRVKGLLKSGTIEKGLGEGIVQEIASYRKAWDNLTQVRRAELGLLKTLRKETLRWQRLNYYYRSDFEALGVEAGQWYRAQTLYENFQMAENAFAEGLLSYREFAPLKRAIDRLGATYTQSLSKVGGRKDLIAQAWMESLPSHLRPKIDLQKPLEVNILGKEIRFKGVELEASVDGRPVQAELVVPYLKPIGETP